MAILKEPTTVDGAKVITELILHPGVRANQIPIWNQTLHIWMPGDVAAGAIGPQGPQGAEGPTGPAGATGHEGPPGHIGDTGHKGDPGPEGHIGPEGHTGPRGERGTGLEFLSAKRDEAAIRAITDMVYGDVHLALDTGNLWVYDSPHPPHLPADADWHSVGHIQGPIGPQGVPGHKGDPGSIGHIGPPGAQGDPGHRGDPGAAGHDGTQGPQGPRGYEGSTGGTGDTGPRGPQGYQGSTGPRGPAGTGSTGARGPTGRTGSQGIRGPAGPAGAGATGGPFVKIAGDRMTGGLTTPSVTTPHIRLTGELTLVSGRTSWGMGIERDGRLRWFVPGKEMFAITTTDIKVGGTIHFFNTADPHQKVSNHYTSGNAQSAPWIVVSGRAPMSGGTTNTGCVWIQV